MKFPLELQKSALASDDQKSSEKNGKLDNNSLIDPIMCTVKPNIRSTETDPSPDAFGVKNFSDPTNFILFPNSARKLSKVKNPII